MLHLVTRTLKLKVRSEAYRWLNAAAFEVNQVWNLGSRCRTSVDGNESSYALHQTSHPYGVREASVDAWRTAA